MRKNTSTLSKACMAVAFILILSIALGSFFSVFRFKYGDGIYGLDKFYEQERDTVDMLVLGSSHAFQNINPAILYSEYGMAAYDLCGNRQPMWNTYHYLLEALKTQSPKLMILEAYSTTMTADYLDEERIFKNTFGLKPSMNLIESLKTTAPSGEFFEYLFRFYRYHNRYNGDLSRADFEPNLADRQFEDWKGFGCNFHWTSFEKPDVSETGTLDLSQKTESYYRKIIELCQEREIPLEIVVSPYVVNSTMMKRLNRAAEIAEEYGVPFTNYNSDEWFEEVGFDYAADMADTSHTNHRGHTKYTLSLGDRLYSTYDLPDRRGEAGWESWERNAEYYWRSLELQTMREQLSFYAFLEMLSYSSDFTAVVSITGDCSDKYEEIAEQLGYHLGITLETHDIRGTWIVRDLEVVSQYEEGMERPFVQLDNINIDFSQGDRFRVNGIDVCEEDAVNILVYDHINQTYLDGVCYDADNDLRIRLFNSPSQTGDLAAE